MKVQVSGGIDTYNNNINAHKRNVMYSRFMEGAQENSFKKKKFIKLKEGEIAHDLYEEFFSQFKRME